ncbi:26S proteasome subunit RPN7-domain-containing protein [Abortiporus biennis]|nr:26S proteasome subunit RPN7-domain-containing protein [Abortiporus biennis]
MDIDEELELVTPSAKVVGKRPSFVPVDDAHPFDLDAYIASYSGRTAIDKIIFLLPLCPSIAPSAFRRAIELLQHTRDPTIYTHLVNEYDKAQSLAQSLGSPIPAHLDVAPLDSKWIEETLAKNQADKTKLEVELKTYSSNMIKESIRMAHRDLGDFYRATGDYSTALKHYTKSREFCTTSQHVLDMCLSVLELLMEQRNYAHITTYVFKADAALEAAAGGAARNAPSGPTATAQATAAATAAKEKFAADKEKVQTKLDIATAISHLGQGAYEKAANSFLKAGPVKGLEDWATQIIAPGDIAIYGTLCALATFSRSAIKSQLLDNDNFGVYIEQEPYVRELIVAYLNSKFKVVLEILERYSTRHYIDIHLSPHVSSLYTKIRNHALVLYFQPFTSIKLERMSAAFGWTVEYLEQQVVALIQSGDIQGRVDRKDKILKAKETDQRTALFERALKAGQDMQSTNRKLLLRMKLQQAELIIKAPKGQNAHPNELLVG